MNKKALIQITLFSIIVLILFSIFMTYRNINKLNTEELRDIEEKSLNTGKIQDTNIIKNIEYFSKDENNNEYRIKSEFGKIDPKKPNLILMENVFAQIALKNSSPITISSNFALYDNISYNTNFYENVNLEHKFHKINSEKIDLTFDENLVFISGNVIYKNLDAKLEADKIRIDLISKDVKIYMDKKKNKVTINSLN
tara:strand:- start:5078 stop:5668 length:591 start_codon:yes stop_codon:yes gene_type:complete